MSGNVPENLWNKIIETRILDDQSDDAKKIIISICSTDFSDSSQIKGSIDFNSLMSMDKEIQKTCFSAACMFNNDPWIINRLLGDFKIDANFVDIDGSNCLMAACHWNMNLGIIRYLIEDVKMDIHHANKSWNNCLILACKNNTNLEIIKYLIQDLKMDINFENSVGLNCLTYAYKYNTNLEIIKYLIESTDGVISVCKDSCMDRDQAHDQYGRWKKIIKLISKNYNRFRITLTMGLNRFAYRTRNYDLQDDLMDFLKTLNPLLLMDTRPIPGSVQGTGTEEEIMFNDYAKYVLIPESVQQGTDIMEDIKFNDYVKYVDELQAFIVPIPMPFDIQSCECNNLSIKDPISLIDIDFTENLSLLFDHNGSQYHGHRSIVYESIQCLREIKDVANFDQLITLSGRIPKYAMNQWIYAMYSKRFNLMNIEPEDIIPFLDHIDQYPTDFLTISSIECDLIRYLDANSQNIDDPMIPCLKEISLRCRLRRLYLWIHNKQIVSDL